MNEVQSCVKRIHGMITTARSRGSDWLIIRGSKLRIDDEKIRDEVIRIVMGQFPKARCCWGDDDPDQGCGEWSLRIPIGDL